MKTVSVIVPTYNTNPEYLADCIQSVLNQSFQDFELLILDDGSTQEYRNALLQNWGTADERIRIEFLPHRGVSDTRNSGIQKAEGTYIAFLDADDIVLDYYLEESVSLAYKYNAEFVIGHTISRKNEFLSDDLGDRGAASVLSSEEKRNLRPYLVGNIKYNAENRSRIGRGPWARLIRRDVALKESFPSGIRYGEDIIWNLALLNRCQTVVVSQSIWHVYRDHDNSVTKKVNPRMLDEVLPQFQILSEVLDFDVDQEYKAYCERLLAELERVYKTSLKWEPAEASWRMRQKNLKKICGERPWSELNSRRFFALANRKEKVKCLFLKAGVFSFYLDLKR